MVVLIGISHIPVGCIEQVCSAWRAGVRTVWGLPNTTHNALLPLISGRLPLCDEIAKTVLSFSRSCLLSDNDTVRFVSRYSVWYSHLSYVISIWK